MWIKSNLKQYLIILTQCYTWLSSILGYLNLDQNQFSLCNTFAYCICQGNKSTPIFLNYIIHLHFLSFRIIIFTFQISKLKSLIIYITHKFLCTTEKKPCGTSLLISTVFWASGLLILTTMTQGRPSFQIFVISCMNPFPPLRFINGHAK